ncbi:VOC family protein [Leucobacter sp. CSA2]|uniref:VOC family protein n=1 Tax=Leucobacter edaphi TaxID=2796472 RepID=A0A934QFA0_9MICO|nr:VOC family protein [Leucobacter edaphi]MBK0422457.1 VOC family protein [Leucobacter edaphi]
MIDQFGKVMIYVENPRACADFWVDAVGLTEVSTTEMDEKIISVELTHDPEAGAGIELFDRAVVAQMSPEITLGTPSILFSSRDVSAMREALLEKGITVGEIVNAGGMTTFNFADPEGNYFAVREIA